MSLAPFSIIVATDSANGIAKNGELPWNNRDDMKFFRDTTVGRKKNAVIMGRITYESIPENFRPLKERHCVVVSRTWRQEDHPSISVYPSFIEALAGLGSKLTAYDEVFVAGGEQIYKEALRDYMYLCKKVYITRFKNDYGCDQFFPHDLIKDYPLAGDVVKTRDYNRYVYIPSATHDENNFLDTLKLIIEKGEAKPERTGVGVRSYFGTRMEFDIRDHIPIFTTKKVVYEHIIKELLFFVSGKTDTRILEEQGVKIWKANTTREFIESRGLKWDEGDMGPGYGHQWRYWGAEYTGCTTDYTGQGVDQLANLVRGLREDPHSRRHILSAWNVSQLNQMCLPPCHFAVQFNVSGDRKWLDCQIYQRSADFGLGVPYNIASYAILTYMLAHITNLRPRKLVHVAGDAHIYNNHGEGINRQIKRTPRPFPRLSFREASRLHEIDDFTFNSFIVEGYNSWPAINMDMAV